MHYTPFIVSSNYVYLVPFLKNSTSNNGMPLKSLKSLNVIEKGTI